MAASAVIASSHRPKARRYSALQESYVKEIGAGHSDE